MAKENLSEQLKKLQKLIDWFDTQEEIDVEKGLQHIKEGAELIKKSKSRLRELENEFEEVRKSLKDDE